MTMIPLPLLPFSVIQTVLRSLSRLLMPRAGGNSCSFLARKKRICCVMRKYAPLFNRLEDLAIHRLHVDASIPFMLRSHKSFQKDVSSYWVTPHTSCRHLVDRA